MKKTILILVVLLTVLSACSKANIYNDGDFEGVAEGKYGPLTVNVTLNKDKITAVEVTSHTETPGISDPAISGTPAEIVKANSIEGIDVVAGATITSQAIIDATKTALEKAKK